MMKFIIESMSKCSGRLGIISDVSRLPEMEMQTPVLLLHSKGASIPHISREVFNMLTNETHFIQINLSNTEHMENAVREYGKSIANFAAHQDSPSILSLKDPTDECALGFNDKDVVGILTKCGKVNISAERYMNVVEAFQPDIYHNLCDGVTSADSARKRISKSVDRSNEFFATCLARHENSEHLKKYSSLLGAIEGGYNLIEREKSIKFMMQHDEQIGGYLIDGLHLNGAGVANLEYKNMEEVIKHSIKLLPTDKMKVMFGAYNPKTMLELIRNGIDMFDSSYAYIAATQNKALTFSTDVNDANVIEPFELDLIQSRYKEEFIPFMKNCECLACKKHTRAYTNHLINTKELLAPILLMMHNLHHYMEFFKVIRRSIAEDTLPTLIDHISTQYEKRQVMTVDADKKTTGISPYTAFQS